MKRSLTLFLTIFCLFVASAFGQNDGVPTFGAADNHGSDAVNLANLVPTINIPVISKPGAFPFSYTLTAQQACVVAGSAPGTYLSCRQGSRFNGYIPGLVGANLIYTATTQIQCNGSGPYVTQYSGWELIASDGLGAHPLPTTATLSQCSGNQAFNQYTTDGSGYQVNVTAFYAPFPVATITANNGHTATFNEAPPTSETDPFGNSVSVSGSPVSGATYTDTIGSTLSATLVPFQLNTTSDVAYNDTTGTQRKITFTYNPALTLSTNNSNCAAHSDGGTMYPIASIGFPDGTSISNIAVEQGPGGTGTTTGRMTSFQLRTGGTVTYAYSAPCSYISNGSATLSRIDPNGTTQYSVSGGANGVGLSTTTVLDPGKNKKVYYFSNASFLLGEDVYQNTGTVSSPAYVLLSSDTICYNGHNTNCRNTNVSYPVNSTVSYHYVGASSKRYGRL